MDVWGTMENMAVVFIVPSQGVISLGAHIIIQLGSNPQGLKLKVVLMVMLISMLSSNPFHLQNAQHDISQI
jgi:hypothetical protein